MLTLLIVVLVVVWLLGVVTAQVFGGSIHILLVVAISMIIVRAMERSKS